VATESLIVCAKAGIAKELTIAMLNARLRIIPPPLCAEDNIGHPRDWSPEQLQALLNAAV